MTKKVLILSSSPRRNGNSDTLCNEFMRGAVESGHTVEKIFLRDKTIHYCTGCSTCSFLQKPCPQKDDAAEVIEKMVAADVIVLGTPVYFYAISAQMKTLIDRCCGRYTEMTGKEFYFISAAAEDDDASHIRRSARHRSRCFSVASEAGSPCGTPLLKSIAWSVASGTL